VRIPSDVAAPNSEFFVALDARHDSRARNQEAIVSQISAIEQDWLSELFPQSVVRERVTEFDSQSQRVIARNVVRYRDLILSEDRDAAPNAREAGEVLAKAVAPRAAEIFAGNEAAASVLARVAFLRQWMPEHPWPKFDDPELSGLLAELCVGKRSVEELGRAGLAAALLSQLEYPLDRLLSEHAPESLEVPTGNRISLDYSAGRAPILAVRLQEVFGWLQTPRIADGRVAVLLHLLGPNYRPVQITDDLKSFWASAYFQVRKDLRVRYPKHSWPEDPLSAKPEAKGRRRN
jgi:ATP-dependent helicase HrpB